MLCLTMSGEGSARVLENESSKPGPYQAGLTIRLALKLEGYRCWHHDAARIHWHGLLRLPDEKVEVEWESVFFLGSAGDGRSRNL